LLADRLRNQGAARRTLDPALVCQTIESPAQAREFHLRIEKTIIKSTDDMFARWNRRMSVPLSRVLAQLPITPNQVTFFTLFVALVGAYLLALGGYWQMLAGAILTQISSILDGNDGELARLKVQDSDFGTWLDTLCDYVSYFLTFGAIGWGLYTRYSDTYYLILVALFFAGLGIAMPLLAYFRKNHTGKGQAGSLKGKAKKTLDVQEKRDVFSYVSARLHHFATRATFSYFLVFFGILDVWPVVLYCAVAGVHAFWISVLYHARFLKEEPLEVAIDEGSLARNKFTN
jgi:phosphatidylglycerophosphate synthase